MFIKDRDWKLFFTYMIFGIITSVINIFLYMFLFHDVGIYSWCANIIAWFVMVFVGFFANKIFVFKSTSFEKEIFWSEIIRFFGGRIVSLLVDETIIVVAIDFFHRSTFIWKIIANVATVLFNYFLGKKFIFKKRKK